MAEPKREVGGTLANVPGSEAGEFEGQDSANQPGVVNLASRAVMENVRDVAGRVGGHAPVREQAYRATGFVPGQVETIDMLNAIDLDQELGFMAHSVVADNPTKQWIFLSSAQRWIPPGTIGYVMQIPKAASKAQARWRAPDALAQPAIGTAKNATFTFCEAWLMPSPGFTIGTGV